MQFPYRDKSNVEHEKDSDSAPPPKPHMLTKEEALSILDCSAVTLSNKVREGRLHPVKNKNAKGDIGARRRLYYHPLEIEQLREELNKRRRYGRAPGIPKFKMTGAVPFPKVEKSAPAPASEARTQKSEAPAWKMGLERWQKTDNFLGVIAAKSTAIFNNGFGVRETVAQLEIPYELAEHLYERWKASGSELHITVKQTALLSKRFDWYESPPTVEGLLRAMSVYIEREIERATKEKSTNGVVPADADDEGN